MAPKLKLAEVEHIHTASRAKAFEAIAVGNLPPGLELELISALDLGTVPWSQLTAIEPEGVHGPACERQGH